jgi:hypothetical protein
VLPRLRFHTPTQPWTTARRPYPGNLDEENRNGRMAEDSIGRDLMCQRTGGPVLLFPRLPGLSFRWLPVSGLIVLRQASASRQTPWPWPSGHEGASSRNWSGEIFKKVGHGLIPDSEVGEPHRGGAEARREFRREEAHAAHLARIFTTSRLDCYATSESGLIWVACAQACAISHLHLPG